MNNEVTEYKETTIHLKGIHTNRTFKVRKKYIYLSKNVKNRFVQQSFTMILQWTTGLGENKNPIGTRSFWNIKLEHSILLMQNAFTFIVYSLEHKSDETQFAKENSA